MFARNRKATSQSSDRQGRASARTWRVAAALWTALSGIGMFGIAGSTLAQSAREEHARPSGEAPAVIYLVRHAERAEDGTNDPPISAAGRARAELLARMLADGGIERIHSTDFRRTRATAAPIAEASGLIVERYDPRNLTAFARTLRETGVRHLVVGHSNTTLALVEALGGETGDPIEEEEYDRFYIVTLTPDGVSTVLLRFGAPGGE